MNSILALTVGISDLPTPPATRRASRRAAAAVGLLGSLLSLSVAAATTNLADQPIFATGNPPGNMALALSVEFPTAISVAHTNRTYAPTSEYLGYFDPDKCYTYSFSANDPTSSPNTAAPASFFAPAARATAHTCVNQWSGNYLNWAMMQTIDTFRWAMTGGYRVIDIAGTTVLEKAWGTNQGAVANFPDSTISADTIAGATPFGSSGVAQVKTRIWSLGNKMRFALAGAAVYQVDYYDNANLTGSPKFSRTETGTDAVVPNVSPVPGTIPDTYWSSHYTTSITIPTTGSYVFQTYADDGVRLYLNTVKVIDNWPANGQSATYKTSPARTYTAGDVVQVAIDYRQLTGGAALKIYWQLPGSSTFYELGSTGTIDLSTTPTTYNPANTVVKGTVYDVFTRAKVCDPTVSVESNCVAYQNGYKPEGLMQQYSNKLRYSVFGYLNDSSNQRDGGVLRARQKFIGPTSPVYGANSVTNGAAEWDATTGVFVQNPDTADAAATSVADSGAMNYVNKFGEVRKTNYKGFDPVSELFYAVVRYFRNIGNVPEWSTYSSSSRASVVDGFPVISNWNVDPILYSCQRNFILGIGDVNTHADKNLPGNTNTAGEPALPATVASDPSQYLPYDQRFSAAGTGATPLTPFTSTDRVGRMELLAGGTYYGAPTALGQVSPINGSFGDNNSALMAGLAYDIHTTGIRPFDASKGQVAQTVDTYWVDVMENQIYRPNNQFWLAAKYGGFDVPTGFKPYSASVTALTDAMWTNGDLIGATSNYQKRPRNLFSGSDPATLRSGLISAFADAASKLPPLFSTSLATSSPQIASSGSGSYAAAYTASNWTGELTGSSITFDADGNPTLAQRWLFSTKLAAQGSASRRIVSWDGTKGVRFTASGPLSLSSAQLALLDTSYVAGDDSGNYLNYLRGDQSREVSTSTTDSTRVYRTRSSLVGDVVNSKPTVVGPPSFPYADSTNPGYAAFKALYANRRTVVYFGANDGMLHAVNGALFKASEGTSQDERDDNAGTEVFAYVPAALFKGPNIPATSTGSSTATPNVNGLASIGNPTFVHHYMVDATPSSFDVDFANTSQPVTAAPDWHTILVGGLGKGGRSYYAIDITDPQSMVTGGEAVVASKVLWEYSEPDSLGFTYGEPIVAKTKRYGWVVILPSGYNNRDGNGHLIVLNARTGALLQKIDLGTNGASNGLAHANSFIIDSTDGTVDSVYAGDLGGNIWRVDLTSATTNAFPAVQLATLTDRSGVGQPITVRPALKVDPTTSAQRRFVMVGTGRLLDTTDIASTQVQSFYAILDGSQSAFNASSTNGVSFPIGRSGLADTTSTLAGTAAVDLTTKAGYYFDLASDSSQGSAASRVTTEASTFYNSVAFTSSQPNSDICAPSGTSDLYALDFGRSLSFLTNSTASAVSYLAYSTTATEVLFFSNAGTAALNLGFSTGAPIAVPTPNLVPKLPRRINWREVPAVE